MIEKQFLLLTDSSKRLKQRTADLSSKRSQRPFKKTSSREGEP
jgi:hypothetical protein